LRCSLENHLHFGLELAQERSLDNLLSLVKEIAKTIGISMNQLNDTFFEKPFIPNNKK
jgi:hypothetical protein